MRPRMNDVRSYVAPFTLGDDVGRRGRARGGLAQRPLRRGRGSSRPRLASGRSRTVRHAEGRSSVAPVSTALGVLACRASLRTTGSSSSAAAGGRDGLRLGRGRRGRQAQRGRWRRSRAVVVGSASSAAKISGCASSASTRRSTIADVPRGKHWRAAPDGIDGTSTTSEDRSSGDRGAAHPQARRACGRCPATTTSSPALPRNMFMVVTKRLRIQGTSSTTTGTGSRVPGTGHRVGARRTAPVPRDRRRGDQTPARLPRLLRGENIGKMLVKVGPAD
jgi:hypothetical protein